MADIGQILLLPPPPVRATDRALTSHGQPGRGAVQASEDGSTPAGASVSEQGRARRFRFRVYEGGETSNTGTELDTRSTGTKQALTTASTGPGNSDSLDSRSGLSGGAAGRDAGFSNPNSGASSAFLAQSIAQEQLGAGLYNPPYAAAAAAYTRTGAALTPRASAGVDFSA
jgi:hypothetical protein